MTKTDPGEQGAGGEGGRAGDAEPALDVAAMYRERAARHRDEADQVSRTVRRISFLRLALALVIILALSALIAGVPQRPVSVAIGGAAAIVFAALVALSQRLERRRRRARGLAAVSEQAAFRAGRAWSRIVPQPWGWPDDPDAPVRADLDVTGAESLLQLLPAISGPIGAPRLRDWLSSVALPAEVRARQESVRELIAAWDLRDALELHARSLTATQDQIARFIAWGAEETRPVPRWLELAATVLPLVTLAGLVLIAVTPAGATVATFSLVATTLVAARAGSWSGDMLDRAASGARVAEAYLEILHQAAESRWQSSRLRALHTVLSSDQGAAGSEEGAGAEHAFQRLGRIAAWAEVRSSPMLHVALQVLLAWDWRVARALDRWRVAHGTALAHWFAALAELECLAAAAGLAQANPGWIFPEISSAAEPVLRARALGHPLLPSATCVRNDVEIGPPGTALVISGSNMSGKSTLLRAVGVNVLLARIGAPVCAAALDLPPLRVMTSIRVQDSLAAGISYFMSEVLRLRDVVTAAEADSAPGAPPVLYLVDEILRGTNSEERAVAARRIVERLLTTRAIGALTTHDLGIFQVPEFTGRLRHAHFAEVFHDAAGERRLVFDYHLREGPATSRNALRLLELVGLGDSRDQNAGERSV